MDDILRRGKLPIIVGGTGLYIDSLISGRDFAEKSDPELRERLTAKANALGGEKMLEELSKFDPQTAEKLHSNDIKRIVRAFEVYELTGKTIYQHDLETKSTPPRYDAVKIALTFGDRQDLYDRINARVDRMMEKGLEKEVRDLLDMGLTSEHTAMQAIGYKEMTDAVLGKCTVSEAVETIKMESRRYAKRQLSWLRRDDAINWIIWEKKPNISIGLQNSTNFLHQYK